MQESFPALTHLVLGSGGYYSHRRRALALPDGFIGGSAPRLQFLRLIYTPFPALSELLLSATDLVRLALWSIPRSSYFSLEVIVTSLAVLAKLEPLIIGSESPLSYPDRKSRRPPSPTRTVLPALTRVKFPGLNECLKDLLARIDTPLLESIRISFVHQLIFDISQIAQFIRRRTLAKITKQPCSGFRVSRFLGFQKPGYQQKPGIKNVKLLMYEGRSLFCYG